MDQRLKWGLGIGSALAAAAVVTAVTAMNSPAQDTKSEFGDRDCGMVNLQEVSVYRDSASASYTVIHCEKDAFGKVSMTDGTISVNRSNVTESHIVAALGQQEAVAIGDLLTKLGQHAGKFEAINTRYVHGMTCEPSIEFKGIEKHGESVIGLVETRKEFFNAMPYSFGCEIDLHQVFGDTSYLDSKFGEEAAQQIRDIMELASKPLALTLDR